MLYIVHYLYFLTNLSMPQVGVKLFEGNRDSEYLTCNYIDKTKHLGKRAGHGFKKPEKIPREGTLLSKEMGLL